MYNSRRDINCIHRVSTVFFFSNNFPASASKKPKLIVSTPSNKPLIKRSILSELSTGTTPNNANTSKFRKPAARKPTKVIDTLTINGARRKVNARFPPIVQYIIIIADIPCTHTTHTTHTHTHSRRIRVEV